MNKFKFNDRVHVSFPHWHDADEIGVVLGSSRGVNNVQFARGAFSAQVPDEFLTLATDWVKCSERMPERGRRVLWNVKGVMAVGHYFLFGFQDEIHLDSGGYFIVENMDDAEWMPLPAPPTEV